MVTVYSKPNCVQCSATYRKLDSLGKSYRVVDVTKDPDALKMVTGMGYQQAPVIVPDFNHKVLDSNGERVGHWGGYIPDYLAQL